jgi:hypothetical protein
MNANIYPAKDIRREQQAHFNAKKPARAKLEKTYSQLGSIDELWRDCLPYSTAHSSTSRIRSVIKLLSLAIHSCYSIITRGNSSHTKRHPNQRGQRKSKRRMTTWKNKGNGKLIHCPRLTNRAAIYESVSDCDICCASCLTFYEVDRLLYNARNRSRMRFAAF